MIKKMYPTSYLLIVVLIFSLSMTAQDDDVILRSNGSEMHGSVVKINEDDLQFVYKNESVEYTIDKSDIIKVAFGSGRIEFFNKEFITSNFFDKIAFDSNTKVENHYNRVAILPFGYIKDQDSINLMMTKKIQKEVFAIFKKNASLLKFQNPELTNVTLMEAGITNNINGYTMGEICNVLDVEYVIQGLVSSEKSKMADYSNDTADLESKEIYIDDSRDILDHKSQVIGYIWNNNKEINSEITPDIVNENYSTNISINIFNNKGDKVFSKEHTSFWKTSNAYKVTLNYLAKQTPIYKK